MMIAQSIQDILKHKDLSLDQTYRCVNEIMSGNVSPVLMSSFLSLLQYKGETVDEIAGAAKAMRERADSITSHHQNIVDTCGTGGDGSGTFNISTLAAIVAASAGVAIAKHGNRAVSSNCGSADILSKLGVNIELSKIDVERCLDQVGIAFLFAPQYHGAMRFAMPVRKELGFRTIFNVLGPLTNPAGARRQVLGVYQKDLTEKIALVLQKLGTEHAIVVHGYPGLDEISNCGVTTVAELNEGKVMHYTLHPSELGIKEASMADLLGGTIERNAEIAVEILEGVSGAHADIVALNAGAAIVVAGKANTLKEGYQIALDAIGTGKSKRKLQELVEFTQTQ